MSYRNILVPVDYSDRSRRAVEHAVQLAEKFGSHVDLLHVVPHTSTYLPMERMIRDTANIEDADEALRKAAHRELDEFVAKLPENVQKAVQPRIELGVAYEAITKAARNYDLIVMGTQGRTSAKQILLGSVAEKVLRHAACPVLVVR